ncbi:hypothetical protein GGTG_05437 [Gaeumannomyces tritici R3-111a-1]|uniref:Uncharacterized protein n=1 Tax=Gaeumannomyces tritici (strain R3-111a-1) TaxID=644352 RepID=J3NVX5_GAET3|nr:hypothetical protein GGTG_05437 [Gaeumannomyces tritici R3-111a-1]EJT75504.1 hypothetical protein GGTG_05437 [Gaeumannomyces tritici R3-111a-1]
MGCHQSTAAQAGSADGPHDSDDASGPEPSPRPREDITRLIEPNVNFEAAQNEGARDRAEYYQQRAAALLQDLSGRLPAGNPPTPAAAAAAKK